MFEKLQQYLVPAISHALYSIVYFLFIIPFDLWVKAIERLALQKENGTLSISKINSPWPLLSFLKTLLLEFLFDFWTLIAYPLGVLFAIYLWIDGIRHDSFGAGFLVFLGTIINTYYTPIYFAWCRDLFQIALMPIRKFVSWCRKPAQHLDLTVKG